MRQVQYQYRSAAAASAAKCRIHFDSGDNRVLFSLSLSLSLSSCRPSLCPTPTEVGKTANGLKTRECKQSEGRSRKRNNSRGTVLYDIKIRKILKSSDHALNTAPDIPCYGKFVL